MKIFAQLKTRLSEISNRLTRITENEPLSPLSIVLVILLDLFVLVNLFIGLSDQTKQLTSPDEYVPSVCREIIIDKNWVNENRIPELSSLILQDQRNYWEIVPDKKDKHPICKDIYASIKDMKDNKGLISHLDERDKLTKRYNSYDAYQKQKNPEVDKILANIKDIDEKINALDVVKGFWVKVEKKGALAQTLTNDLRKINFTYPIKRLGIRILFLLPVIILLFLWNSTSIRKNRYLQTFISSHLLIVSFIPAFFEICQAVFDIIPHKLFQKIMEFLEVWNLIAIWYYILIIVAILLSLFFIYILQKKVFTKARLLRNRLEKKKCVDCGRPLPYQLHFCPFCGVSQKMICKHCNKETLQGASFCIHCGKDQL
ncbi:MAG: zinc ribbon domain-containing protein [Thermodesulfovibrionales bacterium]